MSIPQGERLRRAQIEALFSENKAEVVADIGAIRAQALEKFTRELDGKLANLQDGEGLAIVFTIDIVREDGKIRGGSGAERNMPEYIEWRAAVYARDNWTCQECGVERDLNAHHIKAWADYPELRFDVDNGITLCAKCHAKHHPHIAMIDL